MNQTWSFGRKIAIGFAVAVLLTVLVGFIGIRALEQVVEAKDRVLEDNAKAATIAREIEVAAEQRVASVRGYIITRDPEYLEELAKARARGAIRPHATDPEVKSQLVILDRADEEFRVAQDRVVSMIKAGAPAASIESAFIEELRPKRALLDTAILGLIGLENRLLEQATRSANDAVRAATQKLQVLTALAAFFAMGAAAFLARTLGKQIGSAVGQMQSSSAELQAAATQQATSSREQSTAMSEITTTISEILATSRQIAASAQRVAKMAEQTAGSAKSGDETVLRAHESITGIQRQVELIVHHMLDLGKKSQQIGLVLDIVTELAEQTNILSINATIEATAAGESGRRFAVVADEIRKLADRVGNSAKEIRALIDEVRSAVNTTVMATETGSKTVESGSRQFGEVATSLRQISGLVTTTTEAAREIELSTQQQSTAVEQVNVAIANVAQASKETEAGSTQTLQTASQLAVISRDLLRLVRAEEAT
jgi:methyl-accepting chemotaxis protein